MKEKKEKVAQLRKSMHNYYERQREDQKEDQSRKNEIVKGLYDKPKEIEFKQINQYDMIKHFRFPSLVDGCPWSPVAKAVYVVLCSKANFLDPEAWLQLSRENIGKLAGLNPKTVDRGIKELKAAIVATTPVLETELIQKGPRRLLNHKVYFIRVSDDSNYGYFVFYTSIVESGVWAEISPRAKALYIAMRETAYFDEELFNKFNEVDKESPRITSDAFKCPHNLVFGIDNDEYDSCDTCALWDACNAEKEGKVYKWLVNPKSVADLCRDARITTSHRGDLIEELERVGLVENYGIIRIVHTHPTKELKHEMVHDLQSGGA